MYKVSSTSLPLRSTHLITIFHCYFSCASVPYSHLIRSKYVFVKCSINIADMLIYPGAEHSPTE